MPRRLKFAMPSEEVRLATYPSPVIRLYAYSAPCPLYARVRLIGPVRADRPRKMSYWLGWVIEESRWARGQDLHLIPPAVLDWAAFHVAEAYPDLATATGMTEAEIAEVKAEQLAKRAKYQK